MNIYSKILDPEMSPLGFDAKKMYNFVAKRFINTSAKVQEQALNWLQTLTMLEITIPLTQLFCMFSDGVAVMSTTNSADFDEKAYKQRHKDYSDNDNGDDTICKFMNKIIFTYKIESCEFILYRFVKFSRSCS